MIKKTFPHLLILDFLSLLVNRPVAVNSGPAWKPFFCSPAPSLKNAATT
jgi:hypothetical protein